jgi:DNA-binding protein HU-beta
MRVRAAKYGSSPLKSSLTPGFVRCYNTARAGRACGDLVNERGGVVNKSELIEAIATNADISKSAAGRALDATVEAVTKALKMGDMVTLVGFGSFYVGQRAARTGRNPQTGAAIKIKAAKTAKFRAGKALKDAVQ